MTSSGSLQYSSINRLYSTCLQLYRHIYITLAGKNETTHSDGDGFRRHDVPMPRFSDEYGRLGVWGRNSQADCTGRGSLDDNLRSDSKLRSIVLDLLSAFEVDLTKRKSLLARNQTYLYVDQFCNTS